MSIIYCNLLIAELQLLLVREHTVKNPAYMCRSQMILICPLPCRGFAAFVSYFVNHPLYTPASKN